MKVPWQKERSTGGETAVQLRSGGRSTFGRLESYVPLPTVIFGDAAHFILRAQGDSMVEAGIEDGDLVVVRKQHTAREGEIVVALVDNETTLKRFYLDRERHQVRLHPENREMADIYVDHCYIQGVAQHVIKQVK